MAISITILIEAVIEYIKSILKMFTKKEYKTAVTQVFVIIISIIICFLADVDLFEKILGMANKNLSVVLSGIVVSRGANYVSDLLARLK